MDVLIMATQFLLAIMILVGVHEAGHMVAAKIFGMRVEKYSIGFPPKLFSFKKGETEYSLGMIPLGGFVKISGMVDESLDTEQLSKEPEPYEFRAKPAWQRLIVMIGGILVNIITGILIFIFVLWIYGDKYIPAEEINQYGIEALSLGKEVGLQTGDKILEINNKEFERYPADIYSPDILLGDSTVLTIKREGEVKKVVLGETFKRKFARNQENFIQPRFPFEVGRVMKDYPAGEAGLEPGDRILQIEGKKVEFFDQAVDIIKGHQGDTLSFTILKEGGETVKKQIPVTEEGTIGFSPVTLLETDTLKYSLLESVPKGAVRAFEVIINTAKGLGQLISGEVRPQDTVAGPFQIASAYGADWNWERFWMLTGLISMVLAFMNFLPIPALDGGHVVFLLYEMIAGRKPSDKFMENAQKVGMILLLALMVFVFWNDINKLFFN